MTDRPHSNATGADAPDASQTFANLGAASIGLFQDWLKAAGSAMPTLPGAATGNPAAQAMGTMGAWTLPTLDPQELDKRIQDLRTVQFWLEQNARMIAMTIQGLEVQKMTLDTLKGMNVSMDQLRETLQARTGAAEAMNATDSPTAGAAAPETAGPADAPTNAELINPMRWWDTLTQQFTQMATSAAQATQQAAEQAAQQASAAAAGAAAAASSATPAAASRSRPTTGTATRKPTASSSTRAAASANRAARSRKPDSTR